MLIFIFSSSKFLLPFWLMLIDRTIFNLIVQYPAHQVQSEQIWIECVFLVILPNQRDSNFQPIQIIRLFAYWIWLSVRLKSKGLNQTNNVLLCVISDNGHNIQTIFQQRYLYGHQRINRTKQTISRERERTRKIIQSNCTNSFEVFILSKGQKSIPICQRREFI